MIPRWYGCSRPGFYEEYHQERQEVGAAVNASQWHYPMSEMRAALQRLAAADTGNAGEETILEYTNRRTGGPVMPTIACHIQLLRPGEKTRARRRVCRTNYHVVEGADYSMVGGQRLDWEDKDVHGADVDVPRARQHRPRSGGAVQLHGRAGHEGARPVPRSGKGIKERLPWRRR